MLSIIQLKKKILILHSKKLWLLNYEKITIFRLWDPIKKIVQTSRNVFFNETELTDRTNHTSLSAIFTSFPPSALVGANNDDTADDQALLDGL